MTINKSFGKDLIFPLPLLRRRPEKIHHVNKEVFLDGLAISAARVLDGRVGLDLTVELSREEVLELEVKTNVSGAKQEMDQLGSSVANAETELKELNEQLEIQVEVVNKLETAPTDLIDDD